MNTSNPSLSENIELLLLSIKEISEDKAITPEYDRISTYIASFSATDIDDNEKRIKKAKYCLNKQIYEKSIESGNHNSLVYTPEYMERFNSVWNFSKAGQTFVMPFNKPKENLDKDYRKKTQNHLLIPYRKKYKWGYYSDGEKKIVIPCEFSNASPFHLIEMEPEKGISKLKKIAVVEKNSFWGKYQFYIDQERKKSIELNHKYTWINDFHYFKLNYYAKIARTNFFGTKIGVIDKDGFAVFKCKFEDCGTLTDGINYYSRILPAKKNKMWGVINSWNEIVIPFKFDFMGDFNENGISIFSMGASNNRKYVERNKLKYFPFPSYGFINKAGKILNERYLYLEVRQFSEGLAAVCSNEKWGFVDEHLDESLPFIYNGAKSFSNGLAAVRLHKNHSYGQWGFINKSGKLIIDYIFDEACSFKKASYEENSELAAVKFKNKWSFIDIQANLIIEYKFDEVLNFTDAGIAGVCMNRKWGFINVKGEQIIDCKYDWIVEKQLKSNPFESYSTSEKDFLVEDFLIKVCYEGKKGFIDITGTEYWED